MWKPIFEKLTWHTINVDGVIIRNEIEVEASKLKLCSAHGRLVSDIKTVYFVALDTRDRDATWISIYVWTRKLKVRTS